MQIVFLAHFIIMLGFDRIYAFISQQIGDATRINEEILHLFADTEFMEHLIYGTDKHLREQIDTGNGVRILQPQVVVFVDIDMIIA